MAIIDLIAAVKRQPPSPCDKFSCSARAKCAAELMACSSFRIYAETGAVHSPSYKYPERITKRNGPVFIGRPTPSREEYENLCRETKDSDEHLNEVAEDVVRAGMGSLTELQKVWR